MRCLTGAKRRLDTSWVRGLLLLRLRVAWEDKARSLRHTPAAIPPTVSAPKDSCRIMGAQRPVRGDGKGRAWPLQNILTVIPLKNGIHRTPIGVQEMYSLIGLR